MLDNPNVFGSQIRFSMRELENWHHPIGFGLVAAHPAVDLTIPYVIGPACEICRRIPFCQWSKFVYHEVGWKYLSMNQPENPLVRTQFLMMLSSHYPTFLVSTSEQLCKLFMLLDVFHKVYRWESLYMVHSVLPFDARFSYLVYSRPHLEIEIANRFVNWIERTEMLSCV